MSLEIIYVEYTIFWLSNASYVTYFLLVLNIF